MARRPYKVVAVALANKIARTIWALLVKGGTDTSMPTRPSDALRLRAREFD
ncbi:hypothetical protein Nham_3985 [Nitrobacter hamburgensis X14]|uniref:Transposase n=1 Tax=Nitrobacter hamburgensis (strain DSM 10229 / NCIMB 13809 / X14) TaxID=323097 RepID=Q1QGJ0_NITHX|nr:hypothetical protein Nham_3985 [Nitrobacter hamburgensis X14]